MKSKVLLISIGIFIGLAIASSIGIVIAATYRASDITFTPTDNTWNVSNVQGAINDLSATTYKKVCQYLNNDYSVDKNNHSSIGTKYSCEVGNNITSNFYILKNDGDKVILLAEQNITDTVGSNRTISWYDAIKFFEIGQPGYTTKTLWTNVLDIDLPSAQDILDASLVVNPKNEFNVNLSTSVPTWWCLGSHIQDQPNGPDYCPTSVAQQKASWLFDYLRDCSSRGCSHSYEENDSAHVNGYWTKDITGTDSTYAWDVGKSGNLGNRALSNSRGVRPVITVLKTNLY